MNDKINVLIVCLATTVKLGIKMVTHFVPVDITVHIKQVIQMQNHVLLGHTLKSKEHRVSWTVKIAHQGTIVKKEVRSLWLVQRVPTIP